MSQEASAQLPSDGHNSSDQTPGLRIPSELAYRPGNRVANNTLYSSERYDKETEDAKSNLHTQDTVMHDGSEEDDDDDEEESEEEKEEDDDVDSDEGDEVKPEKEVAKHAGDAGGQAGANNYEDFEPSDGDEESDPKKAIWPRVALIAYGSETGTSLDFAEEAVDLLRRHEFETKLAELDAVDIDSLEDYHLVCIVVSTHGEGKMPYNARDFWTRLKASKTKRPRMKFAVFGVGDSKYTKYNWAGLSIYEAFLLRHAKALLNMQNDGMGDCASPTGVDEAFQHFTQELEVVLNNKFPLPNGRETSIGRLPPKWILTFTNPDDKNPSDTFVKNREAGSEADIEDLPFDEEVIPMKNSFTLTVKKNLQITADETDDVDIKDIRHFVLEKEGEMVEYGPLDVLSITPKNPIADVIALMKSQGWYEHRNKTVKFVPAQGGAPQSLLEKPLQGVEVPQQLTIFKLLLHYLDFRGLPRRSYFGKLGQFATNGPERYRLIELQNQADDFYDYATRPKKNMAEVLAEFRSVKIPWYYIADFFPVMGARDFSIASGGRLKTDPTGRKTMFELTVDIISENTGRFYRKNMPIWYGGLCTSYLASRLPGATISAVLKRTKVKFRARDIYAPFVMAACGTGIAPIRSLLYEYEHLARTTGANLHDAEDPLVNLVVQGHRNKDRDFLFGGEWDAEIKPTVPLTALSAFSRPGPRKRGPYVQGVLAGLPAGTLYVPLVLKGGIVYICGKAGDFPKGVEKAVIGNFMESGMGKEEAEDWVETMKRVGKWRMEVW